MRVVLDVNVLVSALLSPTGPPARLVAAWQAGQFDLIVSPLLLAELRRALAYPKLRKRVHEDEADRFADLLARAAILTTDPSDPPRRAADPGDDYLLARADEANAVIVSGDDHVLDLRPELPIYAPADFLFVISVDSEAHPGEG